ncbi:hypothetical protein Y032_0112g273 [Ancylostoma ceylanicum]|uniref:Uncharacterized protein n=1 Tax=Ancylostoma ceylanicum TaxID=53326 RepID=A0A016TCV8_9BILA|nr:hypothetical protein Y032_0112g273 [Ancylostoma ceylanicum]
MLKYSELRTAVDKGRDHGAAFMGRDAGCKPALVVCFCLQQRTRVPCRTRQPAPVWGVSVSLSKNAAPRSRLLSMAVWSSL